MAPTILFFLSFRYLPGFEAIWLFVVLVFLPLAVVVLFYFFKLLYQKQKFKAEFLDYLEKVLFNLELGISFRDSTQQSKASLSKNSLYIVDEIINFVVFPQRNISNIKDLFIKEVIIFFRKADQSPHLCIERVKFKLQQLKNSNIFDVGLWLSLIKLDFKWGLCVFYM